MQATTISNFDRKTALVTGSAARIGATLITRLHTFGYNVAIHYRHSKAPAETLCEQLNTHRAESAIALQADLCDIKQCQTLIDNTTKHFGSLHVLVNNASSFYPTPVGKVTLEQWEDLHCSNLKAPFFLAQAATPWLKASHGCIVNMADIHGQNPLSNHPVYCAAKAGLIMLTRSLAKELAPQIRVNAIAPGSILWPEGAASLNKLQKQKINDEIALQRQGNPNDLADTLLFLTESGSAYITGQIIAVDGGRSL